MSAVVCWSGLILNCLFFLIYKSADWPFRRLKPHTPEELKPPEPCHSSGHQQEKELFFSPSYGCCSIQKILNLPPLNNSDGPPPVLHYFYWPYTGALLKQQRYWLNYPESNQMWCVFSIWPRGMSCKYIIVAAISFPFSRLWDDTHTQASLPTYLNARWTYCLSAVSLQAKGDQWSLMMHLCCIVALRCGTPVLGQEIKAAFFHLWNCRCPILAFYFLWKKSKNNNIPISTLCMLWKDRQICLHFTFLSLHHPKYYIIIPNTARRNPRQCLRWQGVAFVCFLL